MKWIKDKDFIRGDIPMTKFDVRILTMGYLAIEEGDRFIDIGSGTGSISIEADLQGASVMAIEREEEGVDLLLQNQKKFNTSIEVIQGYAPQDLPDKVFNKAFIGGSGGNLEGIFEYLDSHLESGGILCGNFIMLKNSGEFTNLLKKFAYKNIETHLIQSSYVDRIGLLRGQNPIFIIKGVKA